SLRDALPISPTEWSGPCECGSALVRVGGRATALRPVDGLASACAAALTPTARLALLVTGARRGTATIRGPAAALAGATAARTALAVRPAARPLLVGLAFGVPTRQAALGALRQAARGAEGGRGGSAARCSRSLPVRRSRVRGPG